MVCLHASNPRKWNRRVSYPFIIFSLGASIIFTKTVFMNGLLSTVCAQCASKIPEARSMKLQKRTKTECVHSTENKQLVQPYKLFYLTLTLNMYNNLKHYLFNNNESKDCDTFVKIFFLGFPPLYILTCRQHRFLNKLLQELSRAKRTLSLKPSARNAQHARKDPIRKDSTKCYSMIQVGSRRCLDFYSTAVNSLHSTHSHRHPLHDQFYFQKVVASPTILGLLMTFKCTMCNVEVCSTFILQSSLSRLIKKSL